MQTKQSKFYEKANILLIYFAGGRGSSYHPHQLNPDK